MFNNNLMMSSGDITPVDDLISIGTFDTYSSGVTSLDGSITCITSDGILKIYENEVLLFTTPRISVPNYDQGYDVTSFNNQISVDGSKIVIHMKYQQIGFADNYYRTLVFNRVIDDWIEDSVQLNNTNKTFPINSDASKFYEISGDDILIHDYVIGSPLTLNSQFTVATGPGNLEVSGDDNTILIRYPTNVKVYNFNVSWSLVFTTETYNLPRNITISNDGLIFLCNVNAIGDSFVTLKRFKLDGTWSEVASFPIVNSISTTNADLQLSQDGSVYTASYQNPVSSIHRFKNNARSTEIGLPVNTIAIATNNTVNKLSKNLIANGSKYLTMTELSSSPFPLTWYFTTINDLEI